MKTILVLTDFSDNATHAAESALYLSEKLNRKLFLFHSSPRMPVIPYESGGAWAQHDATWWVDDGREKLDELSDHLKVKMSHSHEKPAIHTQIGEGDLGENLRELLNNEDVDMIVMGAPLGSTIDHLLSGSEISAVLKHASRPVFVIPPKSKQGAIKSVVYATDFKEEDKRAIALLIRIGKIMDFKLDVVHVRLPDDGSAYNAEQEKVFIRYIEKLDYPELTYQTLRGYNVINRLNTFCQETKADVLAMLHEQQVGITGLFHHSESKEAISLQTIPMLIFPSNLKD